MRQASQGESGQKRLLLYLLHPSVHPSNSCPSHALPSPHPHSPPLCQLRAVAEPRAHLRGISLLKFISISAASSFIHSVWKDWNAPLPLAFTFHSFLFSACFSLNVSFFPFLWLCSPHPSHFYCFLHCPAPQLFISLNSLSFCLFPLCFPFFPHLLFSLSLTALCRHSPVNARHSFVRLEQTKVDHITWKKTALLNRRPSEREADKKRGSIKADQKSERWKRGTPVLCCPRVNLQLSPLLLDIYALFE